MKSVSSLGNRCSKDGISGEIVIEKGKNLSNANNCRINFGMNVRREWKWLCSFKFINFNTDFLIISFVNGNGKINGDFFCSILPIEVVKKKL